MENIGSLLAFLSSHEKSLKLQLLSLNSNLITNSSSQENQRNKKPLYSASRLKLQNTHRSPNSRPQTCSPDYSSVKSKISSFREKPTQQSMKTKVSLQDKVRNELLLKNNQVIMRIMNQTIRNEEKIVSAGKPESDASFQRLARKVQKPTETKPVQNLNDHVNYSKMVQKPNEATTKTLMISQSKWLSKRGMENKQKKSLIAKQIFSMLDRNSDDEVTAEGLLAFFTEIGVPLAPKSLIFLLCNVMNVKDIKGKSVKEEHIELLCKGDKKINQILHILNLQILGRTGNEISSAEHEGIIMTWWKEMDKSCSNLISSSDVCDLLVKLFIFTDYSDAKAYVSRVNNNESFLDMTQFKSLFAGSLVKHILININKKFTKDDWNSPTFSYAYKICQLKRQLILAGVKFPIPNISEEEGLIAIKAIEDLARYNNVGTSNITYEEFKNLWLKNTGLILKSQKRSPLDKIDLHTPKLAVFYPKAQEELEPTLEGTEPRSLSNENKHSTQRTQLLSNSFNKGFKTRKMNIKRPITQDEHRCAKQTILFSEYQKIVNKIF